MNDKDENNSPFKYSSVDDPDQAPIEEEDNTPKPDDPLINWSSVNSFSPPKKAKWYLSVIAIFIVISGLIYLLTKDKISTTAIMICGILMAIYGGKKPKVVNYQLARSGFTVNGKYYSFNEFKSFAIIRQNEGSSAILTPLKRFMPYSYIYFERNLEDQITSALSEALPIEPTHSDPIDNFLRRIGF